MRTKPLSELQKRMSSKQRLESEIRAKLILLRLNLGSVSGIRFKRNSG